MKRKQFTHIISNIFLYKEDVGVTIRAEIHSNGSVNFYYGNTDRCYATHYNDPEIAKIFWIIESLFNKQIQIPENK